LTNVLSEIVNEDYEIIFVDDGSTDDSWTIMSTLASQYPEITAVRLSRNFGQHNALMCGFGHANGNLVITIDDDLQIPPEEIPKLIAEQACGDLDLVYGVYHRKHHTRFRNLGSGIIQWFYRRTFGIDVKPTSFRLIRREIVDQILSYEKAFTFIDGLLAWYTTRVGSVEVEHLDREHGRTGYSLRRLLVLAMNMVTNFSLAPLQAATLIGIAFSAVALVTGCYFTLKKLVFDIPVTGFTALIVAVTALAGVQLLTIGVLGEYIGRIHINVNRKPQYAISQIVRSDKYNSENENGAEKLCANEDDR
jgi:undecaprenyl-phosphate 4-deoxy-4-formamido-L-arabinose transferase